MCPVDEFKCGEGPVFSHAEAKGDELEWKGRKRRPEGNIGSKCAGDEDFHPWRIYIVFEPSSTQAEECVVCIRVKMSSGVLRDLSTDLMGFKSHPLHFRWSLP